MDRQEQKEIEGIINKSIAARDAVIRELREENEQLRNRVAELRCELALPELPTVWKKPFQVVIDFDDTYEVQDADGYVIIEGRNEESANICCALLNLAFPAPAEGGE